MPLLFITERVPQLPTTGSQPAPLSAPSRLAPEAPVAAVDDGVPGGVEGGIPGGVAVELSGVCRQKSS